MICSAIWRQKVKAADGRVHVKSLRKKITGEKQKLYAYMQQNKGNWPLQHIFGLTLLSFGSLLAIFGLSKKCFLFNNQISIIYLITFKKNTLNSVFMLIVRIPYLFTRLRNSKYPNERVKIDRVCPVDNRPSTDKLHYLVKKRDM